MLQRRHNDVDAPGHVSSLQLTSKNINFVIFLSQRAGDFVWNNQQKQSYWNAKTRV